VLIVFSHCALDQGRQVRATHDAFVVVEVQLRHAAQLHLTGQLHAQKPAAALSTLMLCAMSSALVLPHHGDEDLGVTDVTADFHGGNGDQADARVFDFTTDQLASSRCI
jgi:hypothetical protein